MKGEIPMIRFFILIPLLVVAIGAGPEGNAVPDVVKGNNQFAVDLYGKTRGRPGNIFFSPYSISTALAMTYTGAGGETAREMASSLHFPSDSKTLEASYAGLVEQILGGESKKIYQLDIANALWGQKGLDYSADFLKRTEAAYQATLHPLDFQSNPESARQTINAWVEQKTRDKIKNLLPPSSVKHSTDLILTNAIYLKAAWASPFSRSATTNQDFQTATAKVSVPLMHHTAQYRYFDAEVDGVQVVDLPYSGGSLSMVVILPRQVDGLERFESSLTSARLEDYLGKLGSSQKVEVFLPRFKLEQSLELGEALKSLGMTQAFTPQADFSAITTSRNLFLSAVIHKAYADINEEGTEAAAATGVVMRAAAMMAPQKPPVVFRADHPFLFLIRDIRSGSILFLGRMAQP